MFSVDCNPLKIQDGQNQASGLNEGKIKIQLLLVLIFLFVGGHGYAMDTSGKLSHLITLSLQELMNQEITTASKIEEKIADIPASVVLVRREDIERHGYRDISEALRHITGLYGIDTYFREGMAFGVRGFWSKWTNKQIILLVDGVPRVNPIRNSHPLAEISVPIEAVERIEVVRGPLSLIYGDGAFFGAINIITELKDHPAKPNLVSFGIGSHGTAKLSGRVFGENEARDKSFTLIASSFASLGIEENYHDMAKRNLLPIAGVDNQTSGGKLEKRETYASLHTRLKNFFLKVTRVEAEPQYINLWPASEDNGRAFISNNILTLGFDTQPSEDWSVKGRLTYRERDLNVDNSGSKKLNQGRPSIHTKGSSLFEGEYTALYAPSERFRLNAGVYFRVIPDAFRYVHIPALGAFERRFELIDEILGGGLFTQINYDINEKWHVVAGLRAEYLRDYDMRFSTATTPTMTRTYDQGGTEFIPRLALIYQPNERHTLKFLYGEAVSWPSFEQNQPQVYTPEVDNLRPERVRTVEILHDAVFSEQFSTTVSVFRNELENLIARDLQFVLDENNNPITIEIQNNSGKHTTNGLEATLRFRPSPRWNLELSASYQRTDDAKLDGQAAYSPKLLGYMKTAYRFRPGATLAMDVHYVDAMDPMIDPATGLRIGNPVEGYSTFGLNLRFEDILGEGTFLNARISNVFDETIRYPTFNTSIFASKGTLGERRAFLLSIGAKF